MPAPTSGTGHSTKRKRSSTEKRPVKRARSESPGEEEDEAAYRIIRLGLKISESKKYHHYIPKLIQIIQQDDENSLIAAGSLRIAFTKLVESDQMTRDKKHSAQEAEIVDNLRKQYTTYKAALVELLVQDGDEGAEVLEMCMELLKVEARVLHKDQKDIMPFLNAIVRSLLRPGNEGTTREEFNNKYMKEHDDIRYYTLQTIA